MHEEKMFRGFYTSKRAMIRTLTIPVMTAGLIRPDVYFNYGAVAILLFVFCSFNKSYIVYDVED